MNVFKFKKMNNASHKNTTPAKMLDIIYLFYLNANVTFVQTAVSHLPQQLLKYLNFAIGIKQKYAHSKPPWVNMTHRHWHWFVI